LSEELRRRYEPSQARLFGGVATDRNSRGKLRRQVAQDMRFLMEQFADDASMNARSTYKNLVSIFESWGRLLACQFMDLQPGKAAPQSNVMQNPTDPGARCHGHKGPGCQVQICETCSEENDVQIIASAIPQTAVETDQDALPIVLDDPDQRGLPAEILPAETHYGSDSKL